MAQAMAKVFMCAFKALPYEERESFLAELVKSRRYREDLIDLAAIESRRNEPSRPFSEYLEERKKKRT